MFEKLLLYGLILQSSWISFRDTRRRPNVGKFYCLVLEMQSQSQIIVVKIVLRRKQIYFMPFDKAVVIVELPRNIKHLARVARSHVISFLYDAYVHDMTKRGNMDVGLNVLPTCSLPVVYLLSWQATGRPTASIYLLKLLPF